MDPSSRIEESSLIEERRRMRAAVLPTTSRTGFTFSPSTWSDSRGRCDLWLAKESEIGMTIVTFGLTLLIPNQVLPGAAQHHARSTCFPSCLDFYCAVRNVAQQRRQRVQFRWLRGQSTAGRHSQLAIAEQHFQRDCCFLESADDFFSIFSFSFFLFFGKPWGKGRLTHDFSGPLASRNPNTGNNSKPIGFRNRFDAFYKRKKTEDLNMRTTSKKWMSRTLPLDFFRCSSCGGEDIRFFFGEDIRYYYFFFFK